MEWISLSEQPPHYEKRVLLCDEYGWVFTGIRRKYLGYVHSDGEEAACRVTHWMPLPASPIIQPETVNRSEELVYIHPQDVNHSLHAKKMINTTSKTISLESTK